LNQDLNQLLELTVEYAALMIRLANLFIESAGA
jgi:hypothetical protein